MLFDQIKQVEKDILATHVGDCCSILRVIFNSGFEPEYVIVKTPLGHLCKASIQTIDNRYMFTVVEYYGTCIDE